MIGSLRLSALLLLLLSRWASADLEKGEDEFVRSWVIIEEQLVPPSRDELLAAGGGGGAAGSGVGGVVGAGRRITPKSVFVAPSFNKCSDGYRPDSMGRCVKVVKLNQAAQWDFLLKQLNSMYGASGNGGFQMPAAAVYQPPVTMTTTTFEPSPQKTDSPGPFQVNIPLAGGMDMTNQTMESIDEQLTTSTTAPQDSGGTTVTDDPPSTTNPPGTTVKTPLNTDDDDDNADSAVTATAVTTDITRPRPYRNRNQTPHIIEDDAITVTPIYDSFPYSTTTTATDVKTKYVDNSRTSTVRTDDSLLTALRNTTVAAVPPSSSSQPNVQQITTTAVDVTDTEEPVVTTVPAVTTTTETEDEDVVTVMAVAAVMDGTGGGGGPGSSTRIPSTTVRLPYTTVRLPYTTSGGGGGGGRTQSLTVDTATPPEYYDDQPDEPTPAPEPSAPDCSAPNAYRFYVACATIRQQQQQLQQQQLQQIQQQQLLLQQHQHQQQIYQQQQQQQFYQQQQQQQFQQQQNHVATALVKRPTPGGGAVQVRFPGDEDDPAAVDSANLIRFPGPAPYRTTNKMYESSRHPTWWPTGWPEQQQPDDAVHQQHRLQHHLPQQKQDVRLWEFGSRLPKTTTTTTTVVPPSQWFHRFF